MSRLFASILSFFGLARPKPAEPPPGDCILVTENGQAIDRAFTVTAVDFSRCGPGVRIRSIGLGARWIYLGSDLVDARHLELEEVGPYTLAAGSTISLLGVHLQGDIRVVLHGETVHQEAA